MFKFVKGQAVCHVNTAWLVIHENWYAG